MHKFEPNECGGELAYVRACRSVRVAYCIYLEGVTGKKEVAHIYCAMGLKKQHNFQQIILGRFKDLTMGALFVAAVCNSLQVAFRGELLSVVESMNAKNRDAARAKFMQVVCNDCQLTLSQEQYLNFSLENKRFIEIEEHNQTPPSSKLASSMPSVVEA